VDLVGRLKVGRLESTLLGCPLQLSDEGGTSAPIREYHSQRFMDALLQARKVDVIDGHLHLWSEAPPGIEIVFSNRYWHPE
jgi:hypothetical protein